jgi:replicative DNA helicase
MGPGKVILLGGPPAKGKTALLTQLVVTALELNPGLRAVVANVEMTPGRLLDRQLARLSGVPLDVILKREFQAHHHDRLEYGFAAIGRIIDRIAFVQGPFDLERVAAAADAFMADLLLLDYLQRFEPGGRHNGLREKINALMSLLRQLASAGVGILAAAALTRSRDSAGRSSYDPKHLNLASFRESSELEYGCDDAFLLLPVGDDEEEGHDDSSIRPMMLAQVKARDSEPQSVMLNFHTKTQEFRSYDSAVAEDLSAAASMKSVWVQPV